MLNVVYGFMAGHFILSVSGSVDGCVYIPFGSVCRVECSFPVGLEAWHCDITEYRRNEEGIR